MVRKQGLVPISEAFGGLSGPVKAIREASPQARHHFTQADQVNQLVSASEADPDPAQTRCRLMYIPFSRHSKAIPRSMASTRASVCMPPVPPDCTLAFTAIAASSRSFADTCQAAGFSPETRYDHRRKSSLGGLLSSKFPFLPSKQENPRITYAKGGYSQTIPAPSAF